MVTVGHVHVPVGSHGQIQRPAQPTRQQRLGAPTAQDLRDLPREARNKQALPNEGQVVDTRIERREDLALTALWIDAKHLARMPLGRDDEALRVELHCIGRPEVPDNPLGCAAVRVDAPDIVGAHHRVVQQAIGTDLHRVG